MPTDHLFTSAGRNPAGQPQELRTSQTGALLTQGVFLKPVDENHLTVAATSIGFVVPTSADYAYVQVTGAPIFWTYHRGKTPASGVGQDAALGDDIYLTSRDQVTNFRAVRNGSTSATLKVEYFQQVTQGVE